MPSDVNEPRAGAPGDGSGGAQRVPATRPVPTPPEPPSSSTSGDELTAYLAHARPDPFLGEYDTGSPAAPRPGATDAGGPGNVSADPVLRAQPAAPSVTSSDALSGLDLSGPVGPLSAYARAAASEREDEDDEDDGPPGRGASLTTLLLASYASAVTLGLLWVLWTGRRVAEVSGSDGTATGVADTRPDPGYRAGRAHRIVAPEPIAADRLARLGKTVRLGLIEATPLGVSSGQVRLERQFASRQKRLGGDNALLLRLKLRNVSKDTVLAPLDEAFLRQREQAEPDSYVELGAGAATIAMYPLAVESEWAIAGQTFRDLRPGESFETLIVSAPDVVGRATEEMTWRIRLRTDINHVEDLGVRFRRDDVRTERKEKTRPEPKEGSGAEPRGDLRPGF